MEAAGRGSAWLERCVRDAEVAGSNPVAPTCRSLCGNDLWKLVCKTTVELPGDWLSNNTTQCPETKKDAEGSWYAAGNHVAPPSNVSPRDWVFYRPLWVVFEKLNRELATEYARRVTGDKSLRDGPREPIIPTLETSFTIKPTSDGYTIECHGLADQLRSLPAWGAFD